MLIVILIVILFILFVLSNKKYSDFEPPFEKHIISYDFDNTLKNQYNGQPVYPIVQRMLEDKNAGKRIIICTARMEEHTGEIRNFLKKYNMEDTPIIATNRGRKSPYLGKYAKEGYIVTHYDDQEGILADLLANIPNIIAYKVLYEGVTTNTLYDDIVIKYNYI